MAGNRLPGPVFISHASADKAFVRRLDGDLEKRGFSTWLDEQALFVGDSLPEKISSGLAEAAVVILVISPASEHSRWLRYELQLAIDRMVKGLRVLPLLIEDATIPPEVRSLVYADFRAEYEPGLNAVIRSLEQLELSIAEESAQATKPWYKRVEDRLRRVFDGIGFMSVHGEYRSPDFDFAVVRGAADEEVEIIYDTAPAYGEHARTVGAQFWDEFIETVLESASPYAMLISERPIDLDLPVLVESEPRIRVDYRTGAFLRRLATNREYEMVAFAVDLSGDDVSEADQDRLLGHIRGRIEELEAERAPRSIAEGEVSPTGESGETP